MDVEIEGSSEIYSNLLKHLMKIEVTGCETSPCIRI